MISVMNEKTQRMDTESFASQYIALSRATGSVCDAFGNRVELKNIPKLLHKLSRGQFKLVWSESFCARDHMWHWNVWIPA